MLVQLCEVTCQTVGCSMYEYTNKIYCGVNEDGTHNVICGGCSVQFEENQIIQLADPVDAESYNPYV